MYCSSCGTALSQPTKFCRSCGAQLVSKKEDTGISASEQRFDEYLTDLFWVAVFGLGIILGGIALMQKVLHLGGVLIVAYAILSSTAFSIVFALSLWKTLRLARESKEAKEAGSLGSLETNELEPASLEILPSIVENTTRNLEPAPREHVTSGSLRL